MVQCFPFHPVTHRQVPFLHWPCSLQRASHSFALQYSPPQPSSHWQDSPTQRPCCPHSKSQSSGRGTSLIVIQPLKFNTTEHGAFDLSTHPLNSPRRSTWAHTSTSACPGRRCRGRSSRGGTAAPPCPSWRSRCPSSPSCRCTFRRHSIRGQSTWDVGSRLM